MKKDNLYQQIKSAKKHDRVATAKRWQMELAMQREIEEAIRPIKEKYEPVLTALKKDEYEKGAQVWHLAGIYHDYGRFFVGDITNIVAVLLTYIEGEKYIVYSNWDNYKITEGSIIIKEDVNKQYNEIDYDILDMLYKKSDLIRLDSGCSNMVDFYNYVGEPKYSFGQFNYLREFVNRLIQYRIDNGKKNVDDITINDLYSFMCKFIASHPDLAQMNKDKREKMLMVQDEEETVIKLCKKLDQTLKQ